MLVMMLTVSGMALTGSLLLLPMRLPRIGLPEGLMGPRKLVMRRHSHERFGEEKGVLDAMRGDDEEKVSSNESINQLVHAHGGESIRKGEVMAGVQENLRENKPSLTSLTAASTSASITPGSLTSSSSSPFPSSARPSPSVAICLVGSPRDFHITGPSMKRHLLSAYPAAATHVIVNSPFDHTSARLLALALASPAPPPLSTPPPPPSAPPNASRGATFPLDPAFSRVSLLRISPHVPLPVSPQASRVLNAEGSPSGAQGLLQCFRLVEGCASLLEAPYEYTPCSPPPWPLFPCAISPCAPTLRAPHPHAPASSPAAAAAFNTLPSPPSLHHGSAFPLFRMGMELCPAVDTLGDEGDDGDWERDGEGGGWEGKGQSEKEKSEKEERSEEEGWQDGVARVAGQAAVEESERVEQQVRNYTACLALFRAMQTQPHVLAWMSPPPDVICTRAHLGPSVPLASSPGLAPFPVFLSRLSYSSTVVTLTADPSLTDLLSMELRLLLPGILPRCMDWHGRMLLPFGGLGAEAEAEGEGEGNGEGEGENDGILSPGASGGDSADDGGGGGGGDDGEEEDEQAVVSASRRMAQHITAHGPLDVLVMPEVDRVVRTARAWSRDKATLPVCQLVVSVPPPLDEASSYHATPLSPRSPHSPHVAPDDPLRHYTGAFSMLLSDLFLLG
ncbi:unnamed protein product [Closterium sp. Naga37s-1]|nr:unnamed protein product [Closterium sp. Naga37s-1]